MSQVMIGTLQRRGGRESGESGGGFVNAGKGWDCREHALDRILSPQEGALVLLCQPALTHLCLQL